MAATGKNVVFGPPKAARRYASVTHDILGDPFWAVYQQGLADAATVLGCRVWHRAPERFSPAEMARLLDEVIATRPAGILATVPDAEVVEAPLRRALAEGVPLIAINAADPRPAGERIPYLAYIGADDRAGGAMVAQTLFDGRQPRRGLVVDHYLVDNACHHDRCAGFIAEFEHRHVPVASLRVPGDDHTASVALIADHLEAHPDVDSVCSLGPPGCAAVIAALDAVGRISTVRHGSFDLASEQLAAIEAGRLAFTVDSQQYLQGYLGLVLLRLNVEHGFVPASDVLTGPTIVTAANLATVAATVAAGRR